MEWEGAGQAETRALPLPRPRHLTERGETGDGTITRWRTVTRCRVPVKDLGLALALVVGHVERRAGADLLLRCADLVDDLHLGNVAPRHLKLVLRGDLCLDSLPAIRSTSIGVAMDEVDL